MCESPDVPQHGAYENHTLSEDGMYKFGDQVRYYCNKGYSLVGEAIRTCADPYKGWTHDKPSCERK